MSTRTASAPPVLVVGTGFGCRIQIPALRAAGFEVVGLVGTDAARTAERARVNGVSQAFTDLDEAIVRTKAVAVAVSTPPHAHAAATLAAIGRGCHVLCEKPFARNASEARTMLQAAERAGVTHVLGHEFRWTPERALLAQVIRQGRIGEPRLMNHTLFFQYVAAPETDLPHWWFDRGSGGGWLGTSGSHWVDWTRTWGGEFEAVSATLTGVSSPPSGAEDSFSMRFRLSSGIEGVMQETGGAWGAFGETLRIAGSEGSAWLDAGTVWVGDRKGVHQVEVPPELTLPPPPPLGDDPRQQRAEWQMMAHVEIAPYIRLCELWKTMIEGGEPKSAAPIPTFADGVACIEVLDAARASAAAGGALVKVGRGRVSAGSPTP
jgi:predicted dehydrogenase